MSNDDPLARLEDLARRQALEETAGKALSKARVQLVLGKDAKAAFFASLALRLKPEIAWDCETAATDGRRLVYNPSYIAGLSTPEIIGLVAHEVMHNALSHHARRGDREPMRANIAMDLSINPLLKEAGFSLPKGGLFPGEGAFAKLPSGLSFEEYYTLIPTQPGEGEGPGNGPPSGFPGDPGKCGAAMDSGDKSRQKAMEAEWQVAVAQAAEAAKGRGPLPGALGRLVSEVVEPKVDWRDVLRNFVSNAVMARDDYAWSSPNRRFISQGLYLPALRSETLGELVIAVDTSGSIDDEMLKVFSGELNGILECNPCKVSIVYCDAAVQRVDSWEPSDGQLEFTDAPGGGGTSHEPVWRHVKEMESTPECIVCLTDGCTSFGQDPGVPVLWALTQPASPPFGRALMID